MAKFNPPENFNFERPSDWQTWRQRFARYRSATKLDKEDGAVQVSTLIYAMGMEAENVFKSFAFVGAEDNDKYDDVLAKFDNYFVPKKNTIHERACFYQRVQQPGEMAESFIRALYELSETCDFGVIKNEHIRDRLVVGIRDKGLSRRLQLMSDLTLETAVQMVRQAEDVAQQISQQERQAAAHVQEVTHRRPSKRGGRHPARGRGGGREQEHSDDSKCRKCGKERHKFTAKCPALDSECRKCGKKGHWARQCFSKAVREVTNSPNTDDSFYLGAVTKADQSGAERWTEQINIGNTPVRFKIDTGADVTVMNLQTFESLKPERKLLTYSGPIDSPGGALHIMGQFTASSLHKQKKYIFSVVVARGPTVSNLLGRETAVEMGLRLLMRLMRFNAKAEYAPGKTLVIADALSRSPIDDKDSTTETVVTCYVNAVCHSWPVSQHKLDKIRSATQDDGQLQSVLRLIKNGWPERISSVTNSAKEYFALLMGRKIRTTLPSLKRNLVPKWPDRALIRHRDAEAKRQQAFYFNKRHGVRDLPQLRPGDQVLLKLDEDKTWKGPASVIRESGTQRSYLVTSPKGGEVRRNRRHMQVVPPATPAKTETMKETTEPLGTESQGSGQRLSENDDPTSTTPEGLTVTRSGRVSKPVMRMDV
ncbi:hypothetical protein N1851_014140 [Merluccius polli]|uniref:CCHC-type domain-containing protein n=1 Tax=Merluccius polli TaxID=89951 RepID=A0AA47MTU9_MERPO|nr:hypothetical protein N1851_014140 [Merluccius polli]